MKSLKSIKVKRFVISVAGVLIAYLLQCTLFDKLSLASVKPNLLLIITAAAGFMHGPRKGMLTGFFSGLIVDIMFGNVLGFYALIYLLIGYVNGRFQQLYYNEDFRLPACLIAGSEAAYGIVIYIFMFMLRSEFDFLYYLSHIILPELIYTIVAAMVLYPLILFINNKLDAEEKRSAGKIG